MAGDVCTSELMTAALLGRLFISDRGNPANKKVYYGLPERTHHDAQ
jgi:hypothetical protein